MIKVKVPATTANMGPGFDSLGMALSRYSEFEGEIAENIKIRISGLESEKLKGNKNLVIDSMNYLFEKVGKRPKGYNLHIKNNIPLARGMGSSAAAIIGGLKLANALIDFPLNDDQLLELATDIEGHPDNVAPALFGNIILSTKSNNEIIYRKIAPFEDLECVLFSPDYEVSTSNSRNVLPKSYSLQDAVYNSSHLALLIYGFITNDTILIGKAMNDKIHEPYRKKLINSFDEFKKIALDSGAFAFSLSGSGSTIIAYCTKDHSKNVLSSFKKLANEKNISGKAEILMPCKKGAQYE